MDSDSTIVPVPHAMEPKPPDHTSLSTPPDPPCAPPNMPTPLVPPHPLPPRLTTLSTHPFTLSKMDLVKSLMALQVSSRATARSSQQAEEFGTTQYNLLLNMADPLGSAREITIHQARNDLTFVWGTAMKRLRRQPQGRQGGHDVPSLELQGLGREP
jgi:hypothetical protein